MFFAMDGYESARIALEEKYQEIFSWVSSLKCRPDGVFYALSDLEQLGLVLATDRKSFLKIAGDFGRLYREKNCMCDGDFAWFFSAKGGRYRKTMEAAVQWDAHIACFFQRESAGIAAREQRKGSFPESFTGVRLSRWLANVADQETVKYYAAAYREQGRPEKRAEALMAFSHCPYPDDPHSIIEDTQSGCEELENAAWRALENIRHPAVREFALHHADQGTRTLENFALLVKNYVPQDGTLMEEYLQGWISQKDWDSLHTAGLDVYRAFRKGSGISHPKHLLPLLYEYNPCSFCRESALVYMFRHRMVTREMWEECLYDSNSDIRRMAEKRLK